MKERPQVDVVERYQKLMTQLREIRRAYDQATGSLNEKRRQLAEEFGCEGFEHAEDLIAQHVRQIASLEECLQEEMEGILDDLKSINSK